MRIKRTNNSRNNNGKLIVIKMNVLLLFTFIISLTTASAQSSVNTSGGNATGIGGSVSYSIGQTTFQSYNGTNGSIANGVQQPYEISVLTSIEGTNGINLLIFAYPNPTTDYLTLEVNDFDFTNLHFQLYDIKGLLLQNNKIINKQTSIFLNHLLPANYFLKVIKDNEVIKIFKLIKK